LAFDSDPGEN